MLAHFAAGSLVKSAADSPRGGGGPRSVANLSEMMHTHVFAFPYANMDAYADVANRGGELMRGMQKKTRHSLRHSKTTWHEKSRGDQPASTASDLAETHANAGTNTPVNVVHAYRLPNMTMSAMEPNTCNADAKPMTTSMEETARVHTVWLATASNALAQRFQSLHFQAKKQHNTHTEHRRRLVCTFVLQIHAAECHLSVLRTRQ